MPDFELELSLVVQIFENRTFLGEALFFPEFSCFRDAGKRLMSDARRLAARVAKDLPAAEWHARHLPEQPAVAEIEITLEPPRRTKAWSSPLTLKFGSVTWAHGPGGPYLGYVPTLRIEVLADTPTKRQSLLEREIRAALLRDEALASLSRLVWLQRSQKVKLVSLPAKARRLSLKQAAQADESRRHEVKSVLKVVATDLAEEALLEAFACDDIVAHLAETLTGPRPRCALLVGPSGVGKTAAVHELVRRHRQSPIGPGRFWRTSGARLVAGMSGFGMWEERCQAVCKEAAQTQAILHVGNLVELMEVGKSLASTIGVAGFLRPALSRGELLAIAECTPEQLPLIERLAPQLLGAFHQIEVREPNPAVGRQILERASAAFRVPRHVATIRGAAPVMSPEALDTLDRLHRRFATYSAFPGRPLRFLQDLLRDTFFPLQPGVPPDAITVRQRPLNPTEVITAFSRETGLPRFLLDPAVSFDLGAARSWFSERVIGQSDAVDLIIDLLSTVKAGLSRPKKPIASLLFIGPTGVGKTEMSKRLSQYLFGNADRLTRFDMSEYSDRLGVNRLIGGVFGSEGVLTGKVREQPFSVLLFDEVEKAAPEFFDLLLQILGDGRLTDAGGRLADFCNSVVIMTSNLGAETFQQGGVGFVRSAASREHAARHFETAVRAFVRPELFNRIDRIVPFAPLDEATVLRIAERELTEVQQRDGIRYRGVELQLAADVPRHLAEKGFDPRYGARPLKRRIERELLAPLADRLNRYSADAALEADVQLKSGELQMDVRARLDARGRIVPANAAGHHLVEHARQAVDLRREHQRLEICPTVSELENELYRLQEWEKRLLRDTARNPEAAKVWQRPDVAASLARLSRLRQLSAQIAETGEAIIRQEERALCRLYGSPAIDLDQPAAESLPARERWERLLIQLYLWQFPEPDRLTLAIFSENSDALFQLTSNYSEAAAQMGLTVAWQQFSTTRISEKEDRPVKRDQTIVPALWRHTVESADELNAPHRYGVVGIALDLRGPGALPLFTPEAGLHELTDPRRTDLCLIETAQATINDYVPPPGIERRGYITGPERRRIYNRLTQEAVDTFLKEKFSWFGRGIPAVLIEAIERRLKKDAYAMLNVDEETS